MRFTARAIKGATETAGPASWPRYLCGIRRLVALDGRCARAEACASYPMPKDPGETFQLLLRDRGPQLIIADANIRAGVCRI